MVEGLLAALPAVRETRVALRHGGLAAVWMEPEAETQSLVDECGDQLFTERGERCCEIDEIAGMRHHRRDARLDNAGAERRDVPWVQWFCGPSAGVLGEDLQCFAAVNVCALDCS